MKNSLRYVVGAVVAGLLCAWTASAQEVKDATPPSGLSGEAPQTTGGPDAFGYTFVDSNEANCSYNFIDISATGTNVLTGDDAGSAVALGAGFDFYGTVFNALNMTSNGYISTDPTDNGPDFSNDCPLPVTPSTGGGARMYPLHDDLILTSPAAGFYEYFDVCPRPNERCAAMAGAPVDESCSIFQWNDVQHFSSSAPWDFEAILYHGTNDIVYQIGAGNPEAGSGSTTGIQNDGATIGLTYACNAAASVPDNSAVCFAHPNDISALCAPVGPGQSILEIPTADTRGLMLLALLLATAGGLMLWRRRRLNG